MKKITILIISVLFFITILFSGSNSPVLAANCLVNLSDFRLYQKDINNNQTSISGIQLINNKSLKNGNITAWISATQEGCNDEFNRWAQTYIYDDSRTPGLRPGCSNKKTFDCAQDNRWKDTNYRGTFPTTGNPVYTDFALGPSGYYQIVGSAYGYGTDSSWSWSAGRALIYEQVNNLNISPAGILSGSITVPWFALVAGPNSTNPNYYLLINNNSATVTNQTPDSSEIQIYAGQANYKGSPDWQMDNIFNFQIQGLTPGQTYYWRIRQQGSSLTTYIPGGSFVPPGLTANPSTGTSPLSTTLTANVGSNPGGLINYYFWWNCNRPDTNLDEMIRICGNPNAAFDNVSSTTQSVTHTYLDIATAKFLGQFANGSTVQGMTIVSPQHPTSFAPSGHASVVYNNKMWVIGGFDSNGVSDAVYSSSNGETWTPPTGHYPFRLQDSAAAVFNNKIWVTGGGTNSNQGLTDSIYSSSDGSNWTPESSLPLAMMGHASVVFDNKLWVIGSGVYYSTGTSWTKTSNFGSDLHSSVVFKDPADNKDKIWVIGGSMNGSYNKVLSSSDGMTWTQTGSLPTTLYNHSSVVFKDPADNKDKIWVIGGWDTLRTIYNDKVLSSSDGITWTQTSTLPISNGSKYTSVVFKDPADNKDKIWVIGGKYVFSSADGITWKSVLSPCSGNISLSINPSSGVANSPLTLTASGLTNCSGKIIQFQTTPDYNSGVVPLCYSYNSGCAIDSLTAPATAGTYTYYAVIDKNSNRNFSDPGEIASAIVTVTGGTGSGGTGGTSGTTGGTGGSPTSSPGCSDAGAKNRATGLVSTPQFDPLTIFNTSGGCIKDPKAAFVPFKIPTFDDLKSLYFTQK